MGENSEAKKRKREQEGSSKPSKKVAIEQDRNVKISQLEAEQWAPVIAATPGVAVPSTIALKPYTKPRQNPRKPAGKSGAIATEEFILQSSQHPKLDYTAREEDAGGSDQLVKHYVGVYDPATGELKVVEARKMVVRGSVREHQASTDDVNAPKSIRELRNDLGETFGTKKSKKAIAAVTENAISANRGSRLLADGAKPSKLDAQGKAILASMASATAGMASREELQAKAEDHKPRPKANPDAQDVEEVYTVDSLIGMDILKAVPVLSWQQDIKNKKDIQTKSRYVSARIVNCARAGTEKLRILRYILLLLEFYRNSIPARGGSRVIPKRDELKDILGADIPEPVVADIRRRYSDGGNMSKYKSDLLITHLCALACVVDNFEVDLYELQLDLRLEMRQMTQYFQEIGAKVGSLSEAKKKAQGLDKAAAAQRRTAKLKLPLEYPRAAFSRGPSRR